MLEKTQNKEILKINNSDSNHYSKMTIAEAKKAFRQKGVTRRLISDVDMDDFYYPFQIKFERAAFISLTLIALSFNKFSSE